VAWIWQKLDSFIGGTVIAAAGVTASQAQAFMVQYIQRLGGHLDEAKMHLNNVQHGLRYQLMSETVRQELENEAKIRVAALQDAYHAIADANVFVKPFALLRYADPVLISGTWRDFVPALSASSETIVYIIMAMVLGFIAYEIVKLPFVALAQEPRRRKFRRRG
jgi:hypothetical protein